MAKRAPKARCLDPLHKGSLVKAWGTLTRPSGKYRRYKCEPAVGDIHYFTVALEGGVRRRGHRGAPECPDHAGARIVRKSPYGRGGGRKRQRYTCHHEDTCNASCLTRPRRKLPACPGHHTFTPPLPRQHVHLGERCSCKTELRGINRGDQAIARRHRFTANNVALALFGLSAGDSYARASRDALERAGVSLSTRRRKASANPPKARPRVSTKPRRTRSSATKLGGRVGHLAMDWTEAFAPVIYEPVEKALRARGEAMRAAGYPLVWLLDEIPVYARDRKGQRKKTDGYAVLVLAEMDFTDPVDPGAAKLRLIRAMPKSNSIAWRLLFDEVGYVPDLVASDAGTPIIAAVERHFPAPGPLFVPSIWHLARALRENSLRHALRGAHGKAIKGHLAELGRGKPALSSQAGWSQWWDDLEAIAKTSGAVDLGDLRVSRDNYEPRISRALPALLADPRLPMSTGGLESIQADRIQPVLDGRRFQFANIERTNFLLDLVVCRSEGAFRDLADVAALIGGDEIPYGGWTVPLRWIADPMPPTGAAYRSLRDEALMVTVAEGRGIT